MQPCEFVNHFSINHLFSSERRRVSLIRQLRIDPTMSGQFEIRVVSGTGFRFNRFSRKRPVVSLIYANQIVGASVCKGGGGDIPYVFSDVQFKIKPIQRFKEAVVKVWNDKIFGSYELIGFGTLTFEQMLSQKDVEIPLYRYLDNGEPGTAGTIYLKVKYSNSSANVSNALSVAIDGPSEVAKTIVEVMEKVTDGPSKVAKTIMEEMQKVNDVQNSKETGIANIESSGRFLKDLERTSPKRFSHEELKIFTSGFAYKVGYGGFGDVYKGQLPDGTEVAIKVLAENNFVKEIFEAEVGMMFKTSHRNLVKFYGYCFDDNIKALVLEYMRNGSLDKVLYENHLSLEWERLYRISIEIAKGLSYLHDGCDDQIIHHDVKAANVLLDRNLSPKITDFGLARLMSRGVSHFTWTGIRGTRGYTAPEMCMPSSKITHKCDVYSFGMMMFEVLGMRRNSEGSEWFPNQVWLKFENGELDKIIDDCGIHRMEDRANAKILSMVALWCAQFTPNARPEMSTVVMMLEGEILVKEPPNPFLPAPEVFYSKASPSHSIDTRST